MLYNRSTLAVLLKQIRKSKNFKDFGDFVFQLFEWLGADAVFLNVEEFNRKYHQLQLKQFPDDVKEVRALKEDVELYLERHYLSKKGKNLDLLNLSTEKDSVQGVELDIFWEEGIRTEELILEIELLQPVLILKMEQLQLAQNLSKYEQMLANSMDVMMLIERNDLEYVSPQAKNYLGYNLSELQKAIASRSLFLTEDRKEIEKKISEDDSNKKPFSKREYRIQHKDGSFRWIEWVVRRIFDDKGQVSRMILNFRDVTDKKIIESELEHQKTFLQQILDRLPVDVFLKDSKGKYIFLNQSASEHLGKKISEVIGKTDFEIMSQDMAQKNQLDDQLVFDGKQLSDIHEIESEGQILTYLTEKQLVRVEDRDVLLSYSVNITEQKQNELKLQESTEFINKGIQIIPDSIFVFDLKNFSYIFTNDKILKKLGYSRDQNSKDIKSLIASIIHPDDRSRYFNQLEEIRNGQGELWELEYRAISANGKIRWLFSRKIPFKRSENNKIDYFVGITFDITEQKRREEKLIRTREKLQKAVNVREEFLSVISHEIRTPLNAILGLSNLIIDTNSEEEKLQMLEVLRSSGENLSLMINDILDFSKMRAGQLQFNIAAFSPKKLSEGICASYGPLMKDKGLIFTYIFSSTIPEMILGDSLRLNQILNNLISNAIKFTSSGEITFGVNLIREEEESCYLEFIIQDTGIGIPKSKQKLIFDPFQQVSSKTTRKYGGTGLGLSITKELVERQGGTLKLKSKLKQGSIFRVELEFQKSGKGETKRKILNSSELIPLDRRRVKILYVEDVASNRYLMQAYCLRWHLDLEMVSSGADAIKKIRNTKYDLILMDIQMPEMDGFQTFEKMKELLIEPPATIALSADVSRSVAKQIKAIGMLDYLIKPIQPEVLYQKLKKVLTDSNKIVDPSSFNPDKPTRKENLDLATLYGANVNEYIDYLIEVRGEFQEYQKEMIAAVKNSDLKVFKELTHKILSASSVFELDALMDCIEKIRSQMENKDKKFKSDSVLDELLMHFEEVIEDINQKVFFGQSKENLIKE